jgi:hypothetical protein
MDTRQAFERIYEEVRARYPKASPEAARAIAMGRAYHQTHTRRALARGRSRRSG